MVKAENKIRIVLVGLIIITVSAFVYLFVRGRQDHDISHTITGQAVVNITAQGFSPSTIKVKKGTQVTFTNTDKAQHRVASDPYPTHTNLPGFDSVEPLNTDESYSFIFEEKGTYTYDDHLNPYKMKGTVIVE